MKPVVAVPVSLLLVAACVIPVRPPRRHLIPEGHVGWVRTVWEVPGAPPLPLEEGFHVLRYGQDGQLETSDSPREGVAADEYYAVGAGGLRRLEESPSAGPRSIWGRYSRTAIIQVDGGEPTRFVQSGFFVGTGEQFREAGSRDADWMARFGPGARHLRVIEY